MPICESTPNSTCAYRICRVQSPRVRSGPWVSCALPSGCAKGESSVLGGRLPLDCVVEKSVIDTKLCSFFPLRYKYAIHSSLEPNRLPGFRLPGMSTDRLCGDERSGRLLVCRGVSDGNLAALAAAGRCQGAPGVGRNARRVWTRLFGRWRDPAWHTYDDACTLSHRAIHTVRCFYCADGRRTAGAEWIRGGPVWQPIRGAALAPRRIRRRSSNTSRRRATDVSATTPRSLSRPGATDDRQQAADSGSGGTDLKSLLLKRASFFHAAKRISSREVMHTASSRSPGINTDERQPRFHVPRCIRAAGPGKTRIRSGAPSSVLPAPAQTPLAVNLCSMLATDLLASRDAVHCILLSSLHRSPSSTDRQVPCENRDGDTTCPAFWSSGTHGSQCCSRWWAAIRLRGEAEAFSRQARQRNEQGRYRRSGNGPRGVPPLLLTPLVRSSLLSSVRAPLSLRATLNLSSPPSTSPLPPPPIMISKMKPPRALGPGRFAYDAQGRLVDGAPHPPAHAAEPSAGDGQSCARCHLPRGLLDVGLHMFHRLLIKLHIIAPLPDNCVPPAFSPTSPPPFAQWPLTHLFCRGVHVYNFLTGYNEELRLHHDLYCRKPINEWIRDWAYWEGIGSQGEWGTPFAAADSDSRCPCPGLNILATHGIIHTSGRKVAASKMVVGLSRAFIIAPTMALQLYSPLFPVFSARGHIFDLEDLSIMNVIEHDASLLRPDFHLADWKKDPKAMCGLHQDMIDRWFPARLKHGQLKGRHDRPRFRRGTLHPSQTNRRNATDSTPPTWCRA
ncbi:hypothetical protein L1887_47163 [Cichorium endivia]|nr:hypothetical protein L1887_47163 [Cichorium endivia]